MPFILPFRLLRLFAVSGVLAFAQPGHAHAAGPPAGATPGPLTLVHGIIKSLEGPLPGATVWLQGTRTIAVTNAAGEFELRVPATGKAVTLLCAYAGLPEQAVTLVPGQALGSVYLRRRLVPLPE